jgi:transcription antitermination factor NusG
MPPLTKEYHWNVLYTRQNREAKAEKYLKECNLDVFLPTKEVMRQWSDRKKLVKVPLFPSYLFVRLSIREYEKALQHSSIAYCIKAAGYPCYLPDEQINMLKSLMDNKITIHVSNQNFEPGDQVEIGSGPLSGKRAEVIRNRGREELILRLECIKQNLVVITQCRYIRIPQYEMAGF